MLKVRPPRFLVLLLASCLTLLSAALPAAAVPPPDPWTKLGLEDALRVSKEQHRFLIVVINAPAGTTPAGPLNRRPMWANRTLAAWVKWHAIAINVTDPEQIGVLRTGGMVMHGVPYVFTDGRLLTLFGGKPPKSASGFLLALDLTYDALRARDPIWIEMHERENPAPPRPAAPDPLYQIDDGLAPPIPEPKAAPGEGPDALAVLEAARAARKDDDLALATGLYTWLWERSEAVDPAMSAIRLTVLPAEMSSLAKASTHARQRFAKLRDAQTDVLPWLDYWEVDEWCILNGVIGDEIETLTYLDECLDDADEKMMLPRADFAAYNVVASRPRVDITARSLRSSKELARRENLIARTIERLHAHRHPSIDDAQWAQLAKLRQRVIVSEACRLHQHLLMVGEEGHARAVARAALAAVDTPVARQAFIQTAIAAGQVTPFHSELLAEAEAKAGPLPILRRRLLGEAPNPATIPIPARDPAEPDAGEP